MNTYIILFLCAFALSVLIGYPLIKLLKKRKANQTVLEYVEVHSAKNNTSTMGGIMFILSTILTAALFLGGECFLSVLSLACMLGFGLIGFLDDFIKIKFKRNLGLTPWQKIIGQGGIALIIALFCYFSPVSFASFVPFSLVEFDLSFFIIFIAFFVIIGTTNAVNLIDGLDGLCGKVSVVYLIAFGVILSIFADKIYALGYSVLTVEEAQNLAKTCIILGGALFGFLVFNSGKASVFMGDVGSLAIGGFISCASVLSGLWLYLPILGILYVITAISVIVQVLYYKRTKKRVFLMAPLHHHFEKKGVSESKIVAIYSIISIIVALSCIYLTI